MITGIHALCSLNSYSLFSQADKKKVRLDPIFDLPDLQTLLDSNGLDIDQLIARKEEIKTVIRNHAKNLEQINQFFIHLTAWGLERDPQKMMALMTDIVGLDILTEVIRFKEKDSEIPFRGVREWVAELAPLCPVPPDRTITNRIYSEWKRTRPLILYFIPNLINIFLGAFNFLDSRKRYTTLWEKHLILEIVYKFFVIPYCLITILQPIFVITAKVYLVAALIIVAVGVLISVYQRWFRPLPDEIVNCTNLDKQMEAGLIDPKVGQFEELHRLIASLRVNANVLLIGLSGEGKTALFEHLIQLKHEKSFRKNCKIYPLLESNAIP